MIRPQTGNNKGSDLTEGNILFKKSHLVVMLQTCMPNNPKLMVLID